MNERTNLQVSVNAETLEDLDTIADILGSDIEEIASLVLSCAVEFAWRINKGFSDVTLEGWE